MSRKLWVDQMRGFCMIAILWFHTEVYYAGGEVTPYGLYVQDALAGFFFLSGYLFWRDGQFSLSRQLKSVVRWLVLPYFFFTALIAIPKALAHDAFTGVLPLAVNILSGRASWFVAALIVAEVLFALAVHLTRGRLLPMGFVAVVCLVTSYFVGNRYAPTPLYFPADIWSVNEALLAFFLLYAGYVYRRFEKEIDGVPQRWLVVVSGLVLVVLKLFILRGSEQMEMGLITVSNYPLFVADMLAAVFFMATIFKQMPRIGFLAWTGSHTLVYYFFCGGAPLVVSLVLRKIGFAYSGFLSQAIAFVLVYMFATAIVWVFYRYTNIAKRPKGA
ncbi:MAG: acyltransferase [Prevotella sp.]|nr:acyltransferase [Prevotella sp.]